MRKNKSEHIQQSCQDGDHLPKPLPKAEVPHMIYKNVNRDMLENEDQGV